METGSGLLYKQRLMEIPLLMVGSVYGLPKAALNLCCGQGLKAPLPRADLFLCPGFEAAAPPKPAFSLVLCDYLFGAILSHLSLHLVTV